MGDDASKPARGVNCDELGGANLLDSMEQGRDKYRKGIIHRNQSGDIYYYGGSKNMAGAGACLHGAMDGIGRG
jgi:hypothetical protein